MASLRATEPDPRPAWSERWQTSMGAWFPGETVVLRGRDLFRDLRGWSWMELWLFGITGRRPTPGACRVYEAIWTYMASYPDPRLWNNRIGALAGTARSTTCLGVSAGIALSEATVYGLRPVYAIGCMLKEIQAQLDAGADLVDLLRARLERDVAGTSGAGRARQVARIPGYGRPIANHDERLAPMFSLLESEGLAEGPGVELVRAIERTLKGELGLDWTMNAAAFVCGFAADQGLTPAQTYQYMTLCFSAGILFCQLDAERQPEGAFFPLRCDQVVYTGPAPRRWR